jgi:hypothetical protein
MNYLHIYVEYRAVPGVFRTIDPPPPLHPASVSSLRTKGAVHTRRAVGGSIIRKTPDIGLASYSIIPLRVDSFCNDSVKASEIRQSVQPCLVPLMT